MREGEDGGTRTRAGRLSTPPLLRPLALTNWATSSAVVYPAFFPTAPQDPRITPCPIPAGGAKTHATYSNATPHGTALSIGRSAIDAT